jgi:gas vesicle protein
MMTDAATAGALVLFGTVTGALIGMVPALFLAEKAERLARARELWRRDADLCAQLEELAGEITDRLSGYAVRPDEWDALGAKIGDLARLSGKFPRHGAIQLAIRDLHNTAGWVSGNQNRFDTKQEREQATAELQDRMAKLLAACSNAIGRES